VLIEVISVPIVAFGASRTTRPRRLTSPTATPPGTPRRPRRSRTARRPCGSLLRSPAWRWSRGSWPICRH